MTEGSSEQENGMLAVGRMKKILGAAILGALMMTSLWLLSAPVARLIASGVRATRPEASLQTS